MPTVTVHSLTLPEGRTFHWTRKNGSDRIPVLLSPSGEARIPNGDADSLLLIEALEGIVALRGSGAHPDGLAETADGVTSTERDPTGAPGAWRPLEWEAMVFAPWDNGSAAEESDYYRQVLGAIREYLAHPTP